VLYFENEFDAKCKKYNFLFYFFLNRWGFTPLDDAIRFGHSRVVNILEEAMERYNENDKIDRSFAAIDSTTYSDITFEVLNQHADGTVNLNKRKNESQNDGGVIYNIDNAHNELEDNDKEKKSD